MAPLAPALLPASAGPQPALPTPVPHGLGHVYSRGELTCGRLAVRARGTSALAALLGDSSEDRMGRRCEGPPAPAPAPLQVPRALHPSRRHRATSGWWPWNTARWSSGGKTLSEATGSARGRWKPWNLSAVSCSTSCRVASNGFGIAASWRSGAARPRSPCAGRSSSRRPVSPLLCGLLPRLLPRRTTQGRWVLPVSAAGWAGEEHAAPSPGCSPGMGRRPAGTPHNRTSRCTDGIPGSVGHHAGGLPGPGRRTSCARSGPGPPALGAPVCPLLGAGLSVIPSLGAPLAMGSRLRQGDTPPRAGNNLHSLRAPFKQCYPKCSGPGMSPPRGSLP